MQIKGDGTIETKLVVDGKEFVDSMSQYDRTADAFAQKVSKSVGKVKSDIESFAKAMGVTAAEAQRMMDSVAKNMALDAAAKALVNFSEKNHLAASATAELAAKLGVADRMFQSFGASAKAGADKALQSIQAAALAMQRMQSAMVFDPASNFKASGFDSNFDQFFSNIERALNTTRAAAKNTGVELSRVIDDFYRATQHSGVVQSKDVAGSMFRESANIEAAFRGAGKAIDGTIIKIEEIPSAFGTAAAAARSFQSATTSMGRRAQEQAQLIAGALKLPQAEMDALMAKAQRGVDVRVKTDALRRLAEDAQLSKKEIASLEKQLGVTLNEAGGIGKEFAMIFGNTFKYGAAYMILAQLQQIPAQIYEATAAMDKFRKSYEGVFGARAGETQNYVTAQADLFGKGLIETSKSYLKFAASAEYAGVSTEQTRKIFEATTKAITKVGGTTEDVNGTLVALQQMISKGTVSAEEFRSQFAERIPGAMQMGADAVGVTIAEFRKLMEEGQVISKDFIPRLAVEMENFAVGWEKGAQTLDANVERMKNSMAKLFSSDTLTEAASFGVKVATAIIDSISDELSKSQKYEQTMKAYKEGFLSYGDLWSSGVLANKFYSQFPGMSWMGNEQMDMRQVNENLRRVEEYKNSLEYAQKLASQINTDVGAQELAGLQGKFTATTGGQSIIEGLKRQAEEYFKVLVDIQTHKVDFGPSGESAEQMRAKVQELEAQIRRLTGQEWHAYVKINVDTSQLAKAQAFIQDIIKNTDVVKQRSIESQQYNLENAKKQVQSHIDSIQKTMAGENVDHREMARLEANLARAKGGLEDAELAAKELDKALKGVVASRLQESSAVRKLQEEQGKINSTSLSAATQRSDAMALSVAQQKDAWAELQAGLIDMPGYYTRVSRAQEAEAETLLKLDKAASRSGASAAKAAQQAENFLESLNDQIAAAEAALSGDTLQTKLAQVDKRWNDFARRVDMGLAGAKLSAEDAAEAMARIEKGRGLERQAVEAQALSDALKRVADVMGDIADASGSPALKIKAGMMDLEAWEKQARQAIDQATQDEAQRAELVAALAQGVALKRLEITRDAYESMSSVSQKYWDAEAARIEARLGLVKESADDELAYKIFAAQEWDDFQRRKLEAQANAPRNLGEAIQAVFALDSGSYKSAMGQMQDEWKRTADRMLSLSDDLSSGIAQGLGDALRGLASGDIKSFEDVWKSMLNRLTDAFASFLEDLLTQWLKRNVFDAMLGGTSASGGSAEGVLGLMSKLVEPAASALFQGGGSGVTPAMAASGGGDVAGSPWAGGASGIASGAVMGALSGSWLPVIGTLVGAGIGLLSGLLGQQEEEKEPEPAYNASSVLYAGGNAFGASFTVMDDGSMKPVVVDPEEVQALNKRLKETFKGIEDNLESLGFSFSKDWQTTFTFFSGIVHEDLAKWTEKVMLDQAVVKAAGADLATAIYAFSSGAEFLVDTLGRLATSLSVVKGNVEILGINFERMASINDDYLLSIAEFVTNWGGGVTVFEESLSSAATSVDQMGKASAQAVAYLNKYRTELTELALAQYADMLIEALGGEDKFKAATSTYAERAMGDKLRAQTAITYYENEFSDKLGSFASSLPGFQADWIGSSTDSFWAAYQAAMQQPMPPSLFEEWAKLADLVAGLEDARDALADIELADRAFAADLTARRLRADGLEKSAELTLRAIQMEQELADARKSGATYAQQIALVETQIYELQAELNNLLGNGGTAEDYGTALSDIQDAISWQIAWTQKLAGEALAASSAFESLGESLRSTLDSIFADDILSSQRYAKYRTQFSSLFTTAMGDDLEDAQEAMGKMGNVATSLLDAAAKSLSYQEYDLLKARVTGQLTRAAMVAERQAEYQGVAGEMYTAQGGLLERMLAESKSKAPDVGFVSDANSLLSIMSGVSEAAKATARGTMTADAFKALAGQADASIMQTDLLGSLLAGTLDLSNVEQSQARLLLSSVEALDALSEYTGRDVELSDLMRQQLEIIAAGVAPQDQWASLIETIEEGQGDYIEWLKENIASRKAEADRLHALQATQVATTANMEAYFQGIYQFLLRQTEIERLESLIGDKTSQAATYQQMAMMAMVAGVPMAAMLHMQNYNKLMTEVEKLKTSLETWVSFVPKINIPALAEGGIATAPTLAMVGDGGGPEVIAPLGDLMSPIHELVEEMKALRKENRELQKQISDNTKRSKDSLLTIETETEKQTILALRAAGGRS